MIKPRPKNYARNATKDQKAAIGNARNIGIINEIEISSTQRDRVLRFVHSRLANLDKDKPFLIVTPNPEIVSLASKDKKLTKIINSADFTLPDGIGLAQAAKFLQLGSPKNRILRTFVLLGQGIIIGLATFFNKNWLFSSLELIKGRDFFLELMRLANKKSWRVFFLGGKDKVAEEAAEFLQKTLKKVNIAYAAGPMLNEAATPVSEEDSMLEKSLVEKINLFQPQLLFVGFGAPKQEKWLDKWLPKLKVGGAMTVGGTFDYISGHAKLPPAWMENLGLEWVWRLITQPFRIKRILTAFPIFPIKVFFYKLNL